MSSHWFDIIWEWLVLRGGWETELGKGEIFGAGVVSIFVKKQRTERKERKKKESKNEKKKTRLVDVDFVKEPPFPV